MGNQKHECVLKWLKQAVSNSRPRPRIHPGRHQLPREHARTRTGRAAVRARLRRRAPHLGRRRSASWVQNVCNSERQLEMRLAELKHLETASCA